MANNLRIHRVLTETKLATEALAAYRLIILSTDREFCEYPNAQYDPAVYGVTLHAVAIGKPVEIGIIGVFPVQVDGNAAAIVAGDPIGVHNDTGYGQDVQGAASRPYCASAETGTTVDGDIISCRFSGMQSLTTV